MGFVSYIAIPINVLTLLFCRFPGQLVGITQDLDALEFKQESPMVQYFWLKDHQFWNRANITLICILLEHVIIGLKIVVAGIIPDVPTKVHLAEQRREKIIVQAQEEMRKLKVSGRCESFQDIQNRLERELEDASKPDELIIVDANEDLDEARKKKAELRRKKL